MESSSSSYVPSEEDSQSLLNLGQGAEIGHETLSDQSSKGKSVLNLSQAPEEDQETQVDQLSQVEFWKREPEWLERFLKRTYFKPCSEHSQRRNDLNLYCIDCDTVLCYHCRPVSPHREHRVMKLYRHVYQCVIPIVEIVLHMDCSQIQPYRCNKQRSLSFFPLPHSGAKTSKNEELCLICKRKLLDPSVYSYCSIICKLEAFRKKENADLPPFLLYDFPEAEAVEQCEQKKSADDQAVPTYRKRSRKGIPCRAPLS